MDLLIAFRRVCLIFVACVGAAHAHTGHTHAAPACADAKLACARSPTPAFDATGRLWLAWYAGGHVYVQRSDDQGASFQPAVTVNAEPEPVDDQGEDRVQIALGPNGEIYLVWTRKLDQPMTGHIRFSRSLDGGKTFSAPVNVNSDTAMIAHRFPVLRANGAGGVFIAWIDKRDLMAAKQAGRPYAGAALYFAASTDRGARFQPNRKLADQACECCRIGMSVDARGLPVLFYRHIFPGSQRDHAIVHFRGLDTPEAPARVSEDGWKLDGCPHHGPALATSGGVDHVAWFTAGERRKGLFYARVDGGGTSEPLGFAGPGAERPMVAAQGDTVVLAWKALAGDRTEARAQVSTDGGRHFGPARAIADTAGGSDHPLLVSDGRRVYLSWQTAAEGYRLLPIAEVKR